MSEDRAQRKGEAEAREGKGEREEAGAGSEGGDGEMASARGHSVPRPLTLSSCMAALPDVIASLTSEQRFCTCRVASS